MPRKLTTAEFIAKAKAIHVDKYDYSETEYLGNDKKVKVICPTHGPFTPLANDHLSKKAGCPSCYGNKKLTQEEFLARSKSIWGDTYDYSEAVYNGLEKKVILTCKNDHRFPQLASSHLNGFGCPYCAGLARKTTEEFIAEAGQVHGDRYDYSLVKYDGSHETVKVICKEKDHGVFEPIAVQHLSGTGCPVCGGATHIPTSEFVAKSKLVHGDRYDYSKVVYKGKRKEVTIICKEHGEFSQLAQNHYCGQGCPSCGNSGGFDCTKPGTLYYLRINHEDNVYYKIGITNFTVDKRYCVADRSKITTIKTWHYDLGKEASDKETEILRKHKQSVIPKGLEILTSGNSEIFIKDVLGLDTML